MVSAAYTLAAGVMGSRRPGWLDAARYGVGTTFFFVVAAVFTLAYAFQTHDFRIRYVSHYSDRSMPIVYLVTSLWGGQDGSLLWWTFLLTLFSALCIHHLGSRHRDLQPWIIATLMSIVLFFCVLMLFAANPFALNVSGAPPDGEGLNPLLQNYWMVIHPPMLYTGLISWSIPFAFGVAALVTGNVDATWIHACRRWTLFAFMSLSVGNMLGMLWSYEELGWGGYWAWDPVENASFMPWLTGTAFVHSVLIQKRREMFRSWNIFLVMATFLLTIFGTFLTRSGLIASVHSFAKSDIGIYFIVYLIIMSVACIGLVVWRGPKLAAPATLESAVSREFAFLLNNWILGFQFLFVLLATMWPVISEAVRGETVTVGPAFYNRWMVPLGLLLLALMGYGPLVAWRKASGRQLREAFIAPVALGILVAILHVAFGAKLGYPATFGDPIEAHAPLVTRIIGAIYSRNPVASTALCAFCIGGLVQEFARGTLARMRAHRENVVVAFARLVMRDRGRYGGYIVHAAIVVMYIGFTGSAYDTEREIALRPGSATTIGEYSVRFDALRQESDVNKQMLIADVSISRRGEYLGRIHPSKNRYRTMPESPTTEVAIRTDSMRDIYVILSNVNPNTQMSAFKIILRPFVPLIWIGGLILILGCAISLAPSLTELLGQSASPRERRAGHIATAAAILPLVIFAIALFAHSARAQDTSSLHAGSVHIEDAKERVMFERLLCMCGGCQRLDLASCGCTWAEEKRTELRDEIARGATPAQVEANYRARYGAIAVAVPSETGMDRALYLVPFGGALFAIGLLGWGGGRRWVRSRKLASTSGSAATSESSETAARIDERLAALDTEDAGPGTKTDDKT